MPELASASLECALFLACMHVCRGTKTSMHKASHAGRPRHRLQRPSASPGGRPRKIPRHQCARDPRPALQILPEENARPFCSRGRTQESVLWCSSGIRRWPPRSPLPEPAACTPECDSCSPPSSHRRGSIAHRPGRYLHHQQLLCHACLLACARGRAAGRRHLLMCLSDNAAV